MVEIAAVYSNAGSVSHKRLRREDNDILIEKRFLITVSYVLAEPVFPLTKCELTLFGTHEPRFTAEPEDISREL
jgi:hypothetical protein